MSFNFVVNVIILGREDTHHGLGNQNYTVFDILLKGYKINGTTIEVISHNLNINVYSLNLN